MTAIEPSLPDLVAPPAADGEENAVLMNGLVTEDLPLMVEVPQIALAIGDKIVRNPDDGSEVAWTVTARAADEDGHLVVEYRDGDGVEDEFTFTGPALWVSVEVGQVLR